MTDEAKDAQGPQDETETNMLRIDELLKKLKTYEADRPYGENDDSDKAVAILQKQFEGEKQWMQDRGVVVLYHGSLQYHDPHNLDVDVDFVTDVPLTHDETAQHMWPLERRIKSLQDWPKPPCVTNFGRIALQNVRKDAGLLNYRGKSAIAGLERRLTEPFDVDYVLSSALLYPEQESLQERMRTEVLDILRSSPILQKKVIEGLQGCVDMRQERRLEIANGTGYKQSSVGERGFEPPTSRSQTARSAN